ncbi:DUF559 domain-containing protein [Kytococcus sp. Marseille-QA3725]
MLAHLVRRPDHHAAHESALLLHGLPLLRFPRTVHLAGSTSWARPRAGAVLHPAGSPPVTLVPEGCSFSWAVSPVAQALADLARRPGVSIDEAMVPMDAALHRALVTPDEVLARAPEGGRGIARLRQVVQLADGRTESPGETVTRLQLLRSGFAPVPQVLFRTRVGDKRVDFHLEAERVVVEFDGKQKYEGIEGRDALVHEKAREDALRELGVGVLRVVWSDVSRRDAVEELRRRVLAVRPPG